MIDSFKNVNFVEKHTLLVFIHMALAKNFDSALGTRLSVNAHAHFTECTSAENLANSVEVTQFSLRAAHEVSGTDTRVRLVRDQN
jgi:hypothetical protein